MIGDIIGLAVVLAGVFGAFLFGTRKGGKQATERISHRANVAAEKRKEVRDEIDSGSNADAARAKLRNDWRD